MKRVNKNRVIEQLDLRSFGQKGWMRSSLCSCPECGRSDKFGIKFEKSSGSVHCFHDDFSESIFKYLGRIGRDDLVDDDGTVSIDFKINRVDEKKEEDKELVERFLPILFEEVRKDKYLDDRNFLLQHYKLFRPGYCKDPSLRDYIIFQLFQFGKRVGWQARSKYSKEWHKTNLENYKKGLCSLKLRYKDAPSMDTSLILGGCDDITDETRVLILVEGIFDKSGIDKKLDLYSDESTRCCFTFGNKLSDGQVKVIKRFKSIELIYLLYDEGTMTQVKKIALELSKNYIVQAAMMLTNKDPGDASIEDICTAMEKSVSAIEFFAGRVLSNIL